MASVTGNNKAVLKENLRTKAKEIRKNLPLEEISQNLVNSIRQDDYFKNAKNILLYYPLKYEINLLALMTLEKNFYLPRVSGENLEICPYKTGDTLIKSSYNILEPTSEPVNAKILDLAFIPALMIDKSGYRLGYGCGYYDRFLKKISIMTACAIPKELLVDELPIEKFDVKTNKIFSA